MLFRQLEYFVAVAQERHFARAAEKCYVSQPALSSAIAKLERELNVTLINRGHSFEGLTPEGERLVVWAKRILAEHDAFKAEVDAVRSGVTGTLRLGTVPSASTTASLVLSGFCSAHPLVKAQICSRLASTELYRRLRDFELDAIIVHPTTEDSRDVDVVPLYEERYVLLVPPDMVPAGRRRCAGRTPRNCRWRCSRRTCGTARSSTLPSPSMPSRSAPRSRRTLSLRSSPRWPPATGRPSFRTPGYGPRRPAARFVRSRW
ncbi:bacterial regulatory helix-turn-helix, lysR family protein [Mycobacterium kansasii]|uniref:Probable hydrogen peroxide-inducible genes activator n=1 Tax=Mycobacterium kansasii TaxID=1768 RepID=A0A1V3XAV7_MYCKA|nr:bacterial regulatory helix-turn-helix, lysR family protein [Mycobacterium kansasii]